jgi:replicative DNA helicase
MAFKPDALPENRDAEFNLLAGMMRNPTMISGSEICVDHLVDDRHQFIFKAMEFLQQRGSNTDVADIINVARSKGAIARLGGEEYVREIALKNIDFKSCGEYARIVKDVSYRRKIIEAARAIEQKAKEGHTPEELSVEVNEITTKAIPKDAIQKPAGIGPALSKLSDRVQNSVRTNSPKKRGLRTGFAEIDHCLNGIDRDGTYFVIAARPSTGKTAFVNQLSWQLATSGSYGIFFSQEMNEDKLAIRIAAMLAGVDSRKIRDDDLSFDEADLVSESIRKCGPVLEENVRLVHNPRETVRTMRSHILQAIREEGRVDYVIVDYLQNIGLGEKSYSRTDELENVSKELNAMAKEFHCVFFVLAQLNREADDDTRPSPKNIKGSGQIEQDADLIALMSRKESRKDRSDGKDIISFDIAKGRDYGLHEIMIGFNPVCQRFDTGIFDKNSLTKSEWENLDGDFGKGFDAFNRAINGD